MDSSLIDKLKAMGVTLGMAPISGINKHVEKYPIENVISGEIYTTPLGESFSKKYHYPLDYMHGASELYPGSDMNIISEWAGIRDNRHVDIKDFLFLDTETSGLAGGTGTIVFLLGVGFFTENVFSIHQFFLRDPEEEAAMLAALSEIIYPFNTIVTFNGKSFDVPILTARHILNGLSQPFDTISHIDLLHLARRLWKNRLPSCGLAELEKEILGVYRSGFEVPGWLVPRIYMDYLKTGDARPLQGVFYHNEIDVLSLAVLLNKIAVLLDNPLGNPGVDIVDLASIGKFYEDSGALDKAIPVYERCIQQGLPDGYLTSTLMQNAGLYKKKGDWEHAVNLWIKAAERGGIEASIELAKYYEHQTKEYCRAIYWCEYGFSIIGQLERDKHITKISREALEKRISRLRRKIFA